MASAYLQRNTTSAASSSTTATISVWVKLGKALASNEHMGIFGTHNDSGDYGAGGNSQIGFFNGGLYAWFKDGSNSYYKQESTRRFRDPNAWYHIVYRFDLTESSGSDRIRVYVNNEEITSWATTDNPPNNVNIQIQKQDRNQRVGTYNFTGGGFNYFDGSIAHFHLCDGQSYAPTVFGETDTTTGIWKPIASPSVSYGTNGFFLKMDNSGNMGLDSSGNSNNFTTNGTIIQNKDTPSNVFATMNVLSGDHDEVTTTNGNLTLLGTTQTNAMASTLGVSQGKYYWEAKINGSNTQQIGIIEVGKEGTLNDVSAGGSGKNGYVLLSNGDIYNNGSVVDTGSSFTTNDIIGVALDLDTNYIYFYKNGTLTNSGGTSIVNRLYFAVSSAGGGSDLISASYNFGNGYFGATAVSSAQNPDDGIGIFEYDVPAGYRALCTKSINAEEYS